MNFGDALEELKDGGRVARRGWNGKGMYVALQEAGAGSGAMVRPFLYMRPVDGALVPWVASQTDLLAEDWEVVA